TSSVVKAPVLSRAQGRPERMLPMGTTDPNRERPSLVGSPNCRRGISSAEDEDTSTRRAPLELRRPQGDEPASKRSPTRKRYGDPSHRRLDPWRPHRLASLRSDRDRPASPYPRRADHVRDYPDAKLMRTDC